MKVGIHSKCEERWTTARNSGVCFFFLRFIYLILERGEEKVRERTDPWPPIVVLTRNQTSNLLLCRTTPASLSPPFTEPRQSGQNNAFLMLECTTRGVRLENRQNSLPGRGRLVSNKHIIIPTTTTTATTAATTTTTATECLLDLRHCPRCFK